MPYLDNDNLEIALFNGNAITLVELADLIFKSAGGGSPLLGAKGDLIVAQAVSLAARLPVGINGMTLVADATEPLGVKWSVPTIGGGNVLSTGPVVDGHIVVFNGTSGLTLKTSIKSIADIFADHVGLGDPHSQYALDSDLSGYQPIDALLTDLSTLAFSGNGLKVLRINAAATAWELVTLAGGGDLLSTNNLSDLVSASAARTNLGLLGLAVLAAVTEAEITLADNATNNSTTVRHGFLKKLNNNSASYMDGQGNWAIPPNDDTLVNQLITLSGDVSGNGTTSIAVVIGANKILTTMILNSNVTLAKIQDIGTDRFLGRVTAATGIIEELTPTQAKTMLALVKSDVGLGNADNTADSAKPVSTTQQTALNLKANLSLVNNVDNTSDADKPVSTATQTALNLKQAQDALLDSIATLVFAANGLKVLRVNAGATAFELSTPAGGGDMLAANNLSDLVSAATARANLILGNVDDVSDVNKPVSTAQQNAINLRQVQDDLLDSIATLVFAGNASKHLVVNGAANAFELVSLTGGGDMLAANNLSDVLSAATSRANLGLAALAVLAAVTETEITLADNTTNNVSVTKHGLAPKAPNNAAQFLNGVGAYAVPPDNDTLINQTITLSGDATGSGTTAIAVVIGALKITTAMLQASAVTLAKIQNIASKRYLGRTTTGAGVVEELTAAQLKSDLALNLVDNTADSAKSVLNATEWAGAVKTSSTGVPTGGSDGDIHFQYPA